MCTFTTSHRCRFITLQSIFFKENSKAKEIYASCLSLGCSKRFRNHFRYTLEFQNKNSVATLLIELVDHVHIFFVPFSEDPPKRYQKVFRLSLAQIFWTRSSCIIPRKLLGWTERTSSDFQRFFESNIEELLFYI